MPFIIALVLFLCSCHPPGKKGVPADGGHDPAFNPVSAVGSSFLVDTNLTDLQPCDILVRPNACWLPGTTCVGDGSVFGHAAIVIKGAQADDETELLKNAIIFESHARDVPGEFQLRRVPAYNPTDNFRDANYSFSPVYFGSLYRLRMDLTEEQKKAIIDYVLSKDNDLSSHRAVKRYNGRTVRLASDTITYWYCSLLIWQAFYDVTGIDLDANKGPYVYPNDLINSSYFSDSTGVVRKRVRF